VQIFRNICDVITSLPCFVITCDTPILLLPFYPLKDDNDVEMSG
jgi:hypothetical protein